MGRAEVIIEFCRGFAAGAALQQAEGSETWMDGYCAGRLSCKAAVSGYLQERGLKDIGDQDITTLIKTKSP